MSHKKKTDQTAILDKNIVWIVIWLLRSEGNLTSLHDPPGKLLKETEVIDAKQGPLCFAQ